MQRIFLIAVLCFSANLHAETLKIPVSRDLWISSANEEETTGNNGGAARLKLKGYQEFSILDFDLAALNGRKIEKATLHIKLAGNERLWRVGVSSLASDWTEGKGQGYAQENGSSCFRWKAFPDVPWSLSKGANGYSDITCVMFAEGGTIWSHADATEPNDNWQSIPVDPNVVAARVAGLSYGFVVFDDTGTELIRGQNDPEKVNIRLFPNRFIYSKDQNASVAPFLTVELGEADKTPPSAPTNIVCRSNGLPPGEAVIRWNAPQDALGFFASIDGKEIPRELISNSEIRLHSLGLVAGKPKKLEIRAVDAAGNIGQSATLFFDVSAEKLSEMPGKSPLPFVAVSGGSCPRIGNAAVSVIDELDKILEDGSLIPPQDKSYLFANHIWDSSKKMIRLGSAKNEWVGFQIYFDGDVSDVRPELEFSTAEAVGYRFSRFGYVDTKIGKIGDPLIPIGNEALDAKKRDAIYCEIYVPAKTNAGTHRGKLRLKSGSETLELDVVLRVFNFTLPNRLSFLPEMNCYSLPENEMDYYSMAQEHRTYINRVPYSHRGIIDTGCAPKWNAANQTFDWTDWDKRYSPLFDGSAFKDSPRGAIPIEAFYLPLHENFPADVFKHFNDKYSNGSYWANEAFSQEYKDTFVRGCHLFAEHFDANKWTETCFHFYLNNKHDYKKGGWSRAASPWLLDEPASYQDFAALQFFGELSKEPFAQQTKKTQSLQTVNIRFRGDISRPQWQRDSLDGVLGVNVTGGDTFRRFNRMLNERSEKFGQFLYTYGSTCFPEEGAYQPVSWTLDAWTLGADGIVPWQTVGKSESWKKSDELSLFYPKCPESKNQVVPSHRLKGYRRGQQDVEYLVLLQQKMQRPRWDVSQAVRKTLNLEAKSEFRSAEDAGTQKYGSSPQDFWRLRIQTAGVLEAN